MAGKKGRGKKKTPKKPSKKPQKAEDKSEEPEEADAEPEDIRLEDVEEPEEEDGPEEKEASQKAPQKTSQRSGGLKIFLMFLVIVGLFFPITGFVHMQTASEQNVRQAVNGMAMDICELEEDNPSRCEHLSSIIFTGDSTYQDMMDEAVNLIYFGGGKATDYLSAQQKNFVSFYRLKNIQKYSWYLLFLSVLAVIGIISLVALYRGVLAAAFASIINITLFLLFMWHALVFILLVGYAPKVLSTLARSSAESLKALMFGADFGFSLGKLHLIVAAVSLAIYIIILIIKRSRR